MTNGARDARTASTPLMYRQRPTPTLSSLGYLGVAASPARGVAVSTAAYDAASFPGPVFSFEYRELVYNRHPGGEKVVLLSCVTRETLPPVRLCFLCRAECGRLRNGMIALTEADKNINYLQHSPSQLSTWLTHLTDIYS